MDVFVQLDTFLSFNSFLHVACLFRQGSLNSKRNQPGGVEPEGGGQGLHSTETGSQTCSYMPQALNKAMFGDFEAFEGEGDFSRDEDEWGPQSADGATPRYPPSD